MSTNSDCTIYEKTPGQWYYKIRGEDYGNGGPFSTYKGALDAVNRNHANPGNFYTKALPGCKHDLARRIPPEETYNNKPDFECDRCGAGGAEVEAAWLARQAATAKAQKTRTETIRARATATGAAGPFGAGAPAPPSGHAALLPGVLADFEQRARAARRGSIQLSPAEVAERKRRRRAARSTKLGKSMTRDWGVWATRTSQSAFGADAAWLKANGTRVELTEAEARAEAARLVAKALSKNLSYEARPLASPGARPAQTMPKAQQAAVLQSKISAALSTRGVKARTQRIMAERPGIEPGELSRRLAAGEGSAAPASSWGTPGSQAEAYKRLIMASGGRQTAGEIHAWVVAELGSKAGPLSYVRWYWKWLDKHGHKPPVLK